MKLQEGDLLLINRKAADEFTAREWNVRKDINKVLSRSPFYDGWEYGDILVCCDCTNSGKWRVETIAGGTGTYITNQLVESMRRSYLLWANIIE
jgi:uncharacterized protein CbrC (UPF0167 family)